MESITTPHDDDDPWLDLISQHFFEMETVSSSEDDDDLGMVLIPEGFVEAGRVIAAGVEVGEDEGEADNAVPPPVTTITERDGQSFFLWPLLAGTENPPVFFL